MYTIILNINMSICKKHIFGKHYDVNFGSLLIYLNIYIKMTLINK